MTVQTTYSRDHAALYKGQVQDANDAAIFSDVSEGTILPGEACIEGASHGTVIKANATGTFRGVAVRSLDMQANASGVIQYNDEQEVALLRRGRIGVEVAETVVAGDPVCFIHTGAGAGNFRNDVDGGNADLIVGAEFITSTAIGGIATINIPSAVA